MTSITTFPPVSGVNTDNYYDKTEVETLIASAGAGGTIELSDYYKKLETYSKAQVDTMISSGSTDLSDYYTIAQVDGLLDSISTGEVSLDDYYTKTQTETLLSNKVKKEVGKGLTDRNYTQAEKDKLNGIAGQATKNLPDATLLARKNHTGTQAINTVAGLQAALDAAAEAGSMSVEELARLAAVEDTLPNKADLDGGKLALSQMPDIAAGRKITVADEATRLTLDTWPDLTIAYQLDDGNAYALDPNVDPSVPANWSMLGSGIADGVGSFNTRTGNVLPQVGDYTAEQITESAAKQFVTADQKAKWTAKETIVGAQAKATAAGQDAKDYTDLTFIEKTQKGAANGVATLDAEGKVPTTQLALKTINGETVLGGGDIIIEAGGTDFEDRLKIDSIAFAATKNRADSLNADKVHTHTWDQVTGHPVTATRWPTFAEVTGKPTSYPINWDDITGKPTGFPINWDDVSNKPIVQTVGTSTTDLMSQKAVTEAIANISSVSKSSAYTVVAVDRGKSIDTSSNVTIPASVFTVGDIIVVTNMSASNISITPASGVTFRLAGSSTTGQRTLSEYGVATLRMASNNVWFTTGVGLS